MYRCFFKRFLDFVLSLVALIVLSPILLILTIVGAITMRGNPFFMNKAADCYALRALAILKHDSEIDPLLKVACLFSSSCLPCQMSKIICKQACMLLSIFQELYSMFCTCSRRRSCSFLASTTQRVIAALLALLPMVLSSRRIS